jgi:hypothetical protein
VLQLVMKKPLKTCILSGFCLAYSAFCGPDGTRTRDLRRDRAAF